MKSFAFVAVLLLVANVGIGFLPPAAADPRTTDNPDGSCTVWNDEDNSGSRDPWEESASAPCPKPKTQPAPGGQTTIYDDKNDNGGMERGDDPTQPGEHIFTTPNLKLRRDTNGTCTVYDDEDNDGTADSFEKRVGPVACPNPNPKTASGPGGSTILYDDKDNDGAADAGEEIARTPNARTTDNADGTCTLYNDSNGNGVADAGETKHAYSCPDFKAANGPGTARTVYDDKNDNNEVDNGEVILRTPNAAVHDGPNGDCTVYDDKNGNGAVDATEGFTSIPCPLVKTTRGPGGSTIVYDDKDNDGMMDPDEHIFTTANAKLRDEPNGDCTLYDDKNGNDAVDASERITGFPCPAVKTAPGPGGSTIVYNDKDNDGTVDAGEETARSPNARTTDNPNGTCTIYDDRNGNNAADAGETILSLPCPSVKTANGPGTARVLYDDKNNNDQVDAGEVLVSTPNVAVADNADGTCSLWIDLDADGSPDPGELTPMCPNPAVAPGPSGSFFIYDDWNNDGTRDGNEPILHQTPMILDGDQDGLPDESERVMCARDIIPVILGEVFNGNGGECPSNSDYVPPPEYFVVQVPIMAVSGPDADNDGFPTEVQLQRLAVVFGPSSEGAVRTEPGDTLIIPIDAADSDKNTPAESEFTTPVPILIGHEMGPDADRDAAPLHVTLRRQVFTYDRTTPSVLPQGSNADPLTVPVDFDDTDPDVPVLSIITTPIPIVVASVFGPDADRDNVPTTLILKRQTFTYDRRFPTTPPQASDAPDVVQALDEDDADPNAPAQRIFALPAPIVTSFDLGTDADGDGVHSMVTLHRTNFGFDSRDGSVLQSSAADQIEQLDPDDDDPRVPAQSQFGPLLIPTEAEGTDGDGDRIPGMVEITFVTLTFDRRPGHGLSFGSDGTKLTIDAADGDRAAPIPFDAFDGDGDDIPDDLEFPICLIVDDNTRPEDGECSADNRDYVAPTNAPNPWEI